MRLFPFQAHDYVYSVSSDDADNVIVFSIEANKLKNRMNVFGFNELKAKEDFYSAINSLINQYELNAKSGIEYTASYPDQAAFKNDFECLQFLKNVSYNDYKTSLSEIFTYRYKRCIENNREIIPKVIKNPLTRFLVSRYLDLPFNNQFNFIRLILESIDANLLIQYSIRGYDNSYFVDDLKEYYLNSSLFNLPKNTINLKTIVLTEGKTDAEILSFTLLKLYPELDGLIHFLDINIKNGGYVALRKTTMALAACQLSNKVVVLFDNDFDGKKGKELLVNELKEIPSNFKILNYPDIEIAKEYPLVNNDGSLNHEDVNGKGASIEMYLGENSLKMSNGNLYPQSINQDPNNFQQYGFKEKDKIKIRKNFYKIHELQIQNHDLSDLDLILQLIIN